jgi:transglutaminase-like putative cysteine protease
MKYATYDYHLQVDFAPAVRRHHFLLRCSPPHNAAQRVLQDECRVDGAKLTRGNDEFGNITYSGALIAEHAGFALTAHGEVQLADTYRLPDERPNRLFAYPSPYTLPDAALLTLLATAKIPPTAPLATQVKELCAVTATALTYTPRVTDTTTTAAEALQLGNGVCQDYAHILLALCRQRKILARYAVGFIEGEGNTHAWVEYFTAGCWYALDPTHNREIETGYIKLAHGRDFADCAIERGVFTGATTQQLTVRLKVGMRDFH